MSTTALPRIQDSQAYWLGWLAGGIREALRLLEEGDVAGNPKHEPADGISLLRESLETYAVSGVAGTLSATTIVDDLYAGWIVEAANGEAQAMRDTYDEADEALTHVEAYWHEAAACGHPSAAGHVYGRTDGTPGIFPFRIRQITRAERDELEEYPPVIDREP